MDKYYVTHDIAKVLKGIGFDIPCTRGVTADGLETNSVWGLNFNKIPGAIFVDGYISVPLWVQTLDWFAEKFDILGFVVPGTIFPGKRYSYIVNGVSYTELAYEKPEEAYLNCVIEIIDIILARKYESKSDCSPGFGGQEDSGDNIQK